jgi:signal peptidase II
MLKKFFSNKLALILSLYIPIVALDIITKYIVHTSMKYHETIPVIPGFFNLTYVRNLGSAWGMFSNVTSNIRVPFFWTISICAIVGISVYLYFVPKEKKLTLVTFSLILSGATGNFLDRINIFHGGGYVIDFLDFYIGSYHWPSFNVADSAISVAIFFLLLLAFQEEMERRKTNKK